MLLVMISKNPFLRKKDISDHESIFCCNGAWWWRLLYLQKHSAVCVYEISVNLALYCYLFMRRAASWSCRDTKSSHIFQVQKLPLRAEIKRWCCLGDKRVWTWKTYLSKQLSAIMLLGLCKKSCSCDSELLKPIGKDCVLLLIGPWKTTHEHFCNICLLHSSKFIFHNM